MTRFLQIAALLSLTVVGFAAPAATMLPSMETLGNTVSDIEDGKACLPSPGDFCDDTDKTGALASL